MHSALRIRHTSLCGVARRIGARFGGHGSIEADVYGEGRGTGEDGFVAVVVAVAVAATIERTSGGRSKASRRPVQNTIQIFAPPRDRVTPFTPRASCNTGGGRAMCARTLPIG